MGDTQIYIITTWNESSMYQYLFEYKIVEYFKEPDEHEEIVEEFYKKSGVDRMEKVIDIDIAPYVRYIK